MIRARSSKFMSDADIDLLRIICELEAHEVPEGCVDKNDQKGMHYRGGMDRTRHGFPCLKWDEIKKYDNYRQRNPGVLEKNYCRNPDNDERGPWCFFWAPRTGQIAFGHCQIETCT